MKIANRIINQAAPPFIIAEMSGNHNQSIDRAFAIVEAAAEAGVDAIKLQTYTADTLTLEVYGKDFIIKDNKSIWNGENLYSLYNSAYTPWEWHRSIIQKSNELGMFCFSSPFDESAVDFLEDLNVPAYKIASFENNHIPLIKKVASTKKPLIISTGMASIAEIDEAVSVARENGCEDLALLKCTSTYPSSPENSNILTIPHMRDLFSCEVGLSDHTMGIGTSIAAIAHGATVIEKHLTLDRTDGGVDSAFSLEPDELKNLVYEAERAWKSLGEIAYGVTDGEKKSAQFRRSLYLTEDIKKGDKLTSSNLRIIRPGFGLEPKFYEQLLGRKVNKDITRGTALTWEMIG